MAFYFKKSGSLSSKTQWAEHTFSGGGGGFSGDTRTYFLTHPYGNQRNGSGSSDAANQDVGGWYGEWELPLTGYTPTYMDVIICGGGGGGSGGQNPSPTSNQTTTAVLGGCGGAGAVIYTVGIQISLVLADENITGGSYVVPYKIGRGGYGGHGPSGPDYNFNGGHTYFGLGGLCGFAPGGLRAPDGTVRDNNTGVDGHTIQYSSGASAGASPQNTVPVAGATNIFSIPASAGQNSIMYPKYYQTTSSTTSTHRLYPGVHLGIPPGIPGLGSPWRPTEWSTFQEDVKPGSLDTAMSFYADADDEWCKPKGFGFGGCANFTSDATSCWGGSGGPGVIIIRTYS